MSTEKETPKEEQEVTSEEQELASKPKDPLRGDPPICRRGEVWSPELKKCVPDVG